MPPRHGFYPVALALAGAFLLTVVPAFPEGGDPGPQPSTVAPHRPKVAVVLSGGSAFGLAHVGVLEAIEAAGIPIDLIVGTSMGSIVGGLYAAGYSPAELEALLAGLDWGQVLYDNSSSTGDNAQRRLRETYALRLGMEGRRLEVGEGLIKGQSVLTEFTALTAGTLGISDFDRLPIPYRAVATDLVTGEKVVLGSGSLPEAMRASMAIPGVFSPYDLGGRTLVDGGVVDDLPTDVARDLGADLVIAVVSRAPTRTSAAELATPLAIAGQTADLMVRQNLARSLPLADLVITCDLSGFNAASYLAARAIVERGREAGRRAGPELAALAGRIRPLRPLVGPATEPNRGAPAAPPRLADLQVQGGDPTDEALCRRAFAPLVGTDYGPADIRAAIAQVYASGRYTLVRFGVSPTAAGALGTVSLERDDATRQALYAGLAFTGILSEDLSSSLAIGTAYHVRGLSGENSALLLSVSLLGNLEISASYLQPLGPFFLNPWGRYYSAYDSITYSGTGITLGDRYRTAGLGLWLGLSLGRSSELALGYAYENVLSTALSSEAVNFSELKVLASLDTRDATAVPEAGFLAYGLGRLAGTFLGGDRDFLQGEGGFEGAFRLGPKSILGLAGVAGWDASAFLGAGDATPGAYRASLRHQDLFLGYAAVDPEISQALVLGLGAEARYRVSGASTLFGREYAFLGLSLGWALPTGQAPALDTLLWCASLGLKARLSPFFGVTLAASLIPNPGNVVPVTGALSLDLGSFAEDLTGRR